MKLLILLFTIIFYITPSYAQKSPSKGSTVKIEADSAKHFGNENKVLFDGNVVAISDNFTVTGDKLTVILNKDREFDKIICEGNVHFKSGDMISISDRAEVDQRISYAVLQSNVKVWQKDNFLSGDKVHIYYDEDRIEIDKAQNKRVQLIFTPQKEEEHKKDNRSDNVVKPVKRPDIKEPKIDNAPKEPVLDTSRGKKKDK